MKTKTTLLLATSILAAGTANAVIISGVSASSSVGTFSSYSINNLTNGVGLSSLDIEATHGNHYSDMWMSDEATTGVLTFDLGGLYAVSAVDIWQYNYSNNAERGVQDFDILVSTDGSNFTPLFTDLTLAISQNESTIDSQQFWLSNINATHIQIDIKSNYGEPYYVGLSEVQFSTGLVPEPSSYALLAGITGLTLTLARRRKR